MRSEDEILALVREKAAALQRRRRRLIGASGGIAAALLLVLGVAVASTAGRPNETTVTVGDGMDSTEQPTTTAAPSTTPSPTSIEDRTSSSTTTAAELAGEAGHQARPTGSAALPSRTTTTTTPPPPLCPASAIEMVVTTDRSTYSPGEEVVMTARATNRAGHDCTETDSSEVTIRNEEGRPIYGMASIAAQMRGDWRWRAGDIRTNEHRWDQHSLTEHGRNPVPPGTYTVTMGWKAFDSQSGKRVTYESSATFTIEQP